VLKLTKSKKGKFCVKVLQKFLILPVQQVWNPKAVSFLAPRQRLVANFVLEHLSQSKKASEAVVRPFR
jgi:hypothetical protein